MSVVKSSDNFVKLILCEVIRTPLRLGETLRLKLTIQRSIFPPVIKDAAIIGFPLGSYIIKGCSSWLHPLKIGSKINVGVAKPKG